MLEDMENLLLQLAGEDFCYLTTTGRVTGHPHEIEIWFGRQDSSIYLMAGNHKSDWVLNIRKNPRVSVRIDEHMFVGRANIVNDQQEEMSARYLLAEKYQEWETEGTLSEWARTALVVGIELSLAEQQ